MSSVTITINERFLFDRRDPDTFLGKGGMGSVFKGLDLRTQEPVAIKVLRSDLTRQEPDMLTRFQQEGEALRQLNHPNIVKMLGSAEHDGEHFLVMEYVSGGSLRDVLREERQFSLQRALYVALDLADALTRAHRLKILHRDIKPDNVMLAEDGTPRLTDFGMARFSGEPHLTEDGAIVGTLAYLGPEAFMDEEPDERTDIWAYGVMLYEMLLGERPFPGDSPAALISSIMTQSVPDIEKLRPDLPTALVDLIYRMLNKDRQARIPSVRLIGAEIEALIRDGGQARTTTMQPVVSLESTGRFEVLTSQFPALQTSTTDIPNNLPTQPTPFVGRGPDLEQLEDLLDTPDNRLITILGPGGMGKTRIAVALAERRLIRHTDGAFFVPLAGVDSAEHVLPAIADQLHFTFGGANPKEDLINYLREKNMLLVLDNFEHVTGSADLVADLLANAPHLTIIVTSRERLRLRGEHIYEVNGMIVPKTEDETPERLLNYPSVLLFLQSARRVTPVFDIDDTATARHVAEIIRLVGGLPLGIELAAAWLEALPVDEIVQEISDSLDFLETDLRDVPERHRSIRAVFEYSWNLLTEAERESFQKLSVFRGGFVREAAKKVTGASLRTLTNLVNKSLLQREPSGRYYVHKLLRQYAEERHDEVAHAATLQAHAEYYADFLERLIPALNTHREQAAFEAIEAEVGNVRLMREQALEHQRWDLLDRSLDAFLFYYVARSLLREGYSTFKLIGDALEADGEGSTMIYWRIRARQAWVGERMGQFDEVIRLANGAEKFFQQQGAGIERSYAISHRSYVHMMQGNFDSAIECSQLALEALNGAEELNPYFLAMGNMGYAYYLKGNYAEAKRIYDELLANFKDVDYSPIGKAFGTNNLGEILRDTGETSRAQEHFKDAFEIFERFNHRRGMAFSLNNLAGMIFVQGHYDQAREKFERVHQLYRDIGDRPGEAHALSALGNADAAIGDYQQAQAHYEASLAIRRENRDRRGVADSLTDLARNAANRGNLETADEMLCEARDIYAEIGDPIGEGMSGASLALVRLMQGKRDVARSLIEESLVIGEQTQNIFIRTQGYVGLGEAEYNDGHLDAALTYYYKALSAYDTEDAPLGMILFALTGIARIKIEQGEPQEALRLVTLVLRYPPSFIGMIEERANKMLNELTERLNQDMISETLAQTKSLILRQVVTDLLAQEQNG